MIEQRVNIWDVLSPTTPACITTNGFVKKNGEAVMGAGCAKELKERFPGFPKRYGYWLGRMGLKVMGFHIGRDKQPFIMFPVKFNWWENADLELIEKSANELMQLMDDNPEFTKVYLPRPGCGNGKLDWESQVKPVIEPILDDRVVVTYL